MAKTKKTTKSSTTSTTTDATTANIKKASALATQVLEKIDKYAKEYTTTDGKNVTSEFSIQLLQEIIEEGLALHNFIVEKKLHLDKPGIIACLLNLTKFTNQLTITKENAEKLHLLDALQIWHQTKLAIAVLADNFLNYYEQK